MTNPVGGPPFADTTTGPVDGSDGAIVMFDTDPWTATEVTVSVQPPEGEAVIDTAPSAPGGGTCSCIRMAPHPTSVEGGGGNGIVTEAPGALPPAAALWLRIVGATHVAAAPTAAFRMKRRRSSRDPSSLVPRSRPVPRM